MGFDTFLGNAEAVATVRAMLQSKRMTGSLLFTGPEGVGKKTLALMVAKALNCQRQNADFCGTCAHCRKTEEMLLAAREDSERRRQLKDAQRRSEGLIYLDVQLIEPLTRYILTEQVRQMRQVAYARPFELPSRVLVIDQAQAVHWQAVDLLLKMLEEPPDTTVFIVVCPNAYELRPTIRSRCRRLQFLPVDDSMIKRVLDGRKLSVAQRALAVRVSNGSVAAAKALDLGRYEQLRRPWLDLLESLSPVAAVPDKDDREKRPGSSHRPNWPLIFDSTKAVTEDREAFEESLRIGYLLLRDLMQMRECGPAALLVNIDIKEKLNSWASGLGSAGIERLKSGLDEAYRLHTRNVNQQLGLDDVAIDMHVMSEHYEADTSSTEASERFLG